MPEPREQPGGCARVDVTGAYLSSSHAGSIPRTVAFIIAFVKIRIAVWLMMRFDVIKEADADAVFFVAMVVASITIMSLMPRHSRK